MESLAEYMNLFVVLANAGLLPRLGFGSQQDVPSSRYVMFHIYIQPKFRRLIFSRWQF
jgi:hypothetical protein